VATDARSRSTWARAALWYVGLVSATSLYLLRISYLDGRVGDPYRVVLWGHIVKTSDALLAIWAPVIVAAPAAAAVLLFRSLLKYIDSSVQRWWQSP
jgi:hypothetical protein